MRSFATAVTTTRETATSYTLKARASFAGVGGKLLTELLGITCAAVLAARNARETTNDPAYAPDQNPEYDKPNCQVTK